MNPRMKALVKLLEGVTETDLAMLSRDELWTLADLTFDVGASSDCELESRCGYPITRDRLVSH